MLTFPDFSCLLIDLYNRYQIVESEIFFVQGVTTGGIIPLADADVQTSGAKAAACGRLSSLAALSAKGSKLFADDYFYPSLRIIIFLQLS